MNGAYLPRDGAALHAVSDGHALLGHPKDSYRRAVRSRMRQGRAAHRRASRDRHRHRLLDEAGGGVAR